MNTTIYKFGMLTTALQLAGAMAVLGQAAPPAPTPGAPAATGAPAIRFSETSHDFGKVKPTDIQTNIFIVTNTGTAMLEITDVRPGCGCTTAGAWDKQVAPGQTGRIPIQFNPANFSGTVGKSVMVSCNDPVAPSHILSIQATIWRPLDVQPQYTHFMPIEGETNVDIRVVRITNNTEDEIKIEDPVSNNPQFKTSLKNIRPGKEWEMTVTYVPGVTNTPPNGMINLKTSAAGTPQLSVSAYAMPQPAISAMPPHVQLPAGPLGAGYNYPVAIRSSGSQAITVSDVQVNAPGVTVKVSEATPGKLFNITLGFPTEFKLEPGKSVELTAKTSHPKYPVVRVPITQIAAPVPQAIAPTVTPIVNPGAAKTK